MTTISLQEISPKLKHNDLMARDRWDAHELSLKPEYAHSSYYLNFCRIKQDWFLRVTETKMKKVRLIPISKKCAAVTQEQQAYVEKHYNSSSQLFPSRSKSKSPHIYAG